MKGITLKNIVEEFLREFPFFLRMSLYYLFERRKERGERAERG